MDPPKAAPSVDVVRIEADGAAVIAGRAAPGSELIVLDNGKPIGTTKADAFGEWVFIPDAPLPKGEHAFELVVKQAEGRVTIPAPKDTTPADVRDDSPAPAAPATREPAPATED